MNYHLFGQTGLNVSELCLGTMTFGGSGELWSQIGKLQSDEATAIVKRALDAGINFIDTANVYSYGQSEILTGEAIRKLGVRRDDVVIATKAFGPMSDRLNDSGQSRYHLMNSVDASLKRLGMDHIDLFQLHGFDAALPMEQYLATLNDLVRSGKARYVGVSNWAAWQIMKARGIMDRRGWANIESVQAYYTIAGRDLEREIVPVARDQNMAIMVWSPLAGGLLSGKYDRDGKGPAGSRRVTFDFPPVNKERAFACIDAMRPMAEKRKVSVAQIAIAWLLRQPAVTTVIVGAKDAKQLDDNLAATGVKLGEDELKTLNEVSALPPEYPGWMLERQGAYRKGRGVEP